jgi:phospholipid/cholesterol/gamma-HCH transport system substrate-binding protein
MRGGARGFRYANESVGVLVLVSVVLFVAAALQSGRVREWLDPGLLLRVVLPDSGLQGLADGADVEVLGTRAGQVDQIVIDPDQRFYAEVRLERDAMSFVRRDSKVVIRKRFGVAGASFLDISRGVAEPLDWDYAVLTAQAERAPQETVGELLEDLKIKLFPIIDDTQRTVSAVASLTESLREPQGPLLSVLANLDALTGSLARGEGPAGAVLTDEAMAGDLREIVERLNRDLVRVGPLLAELQTTIANLAVVTGGVADQTSELPALSARVQSVLGSVDAVLADLRKATPELPTIARNASATTESLPGLLLQTEQAALELEGLLTQLRGLWLLGGEGGSSRVEGRIPARELRP